ncbi:protein lin-37 homolog isoform X2 [Cimex lectularius]|nr:protein lin-37 homolog isoform X2 [Cimex lectularius]
MVKKRRLPSSNKGRTVERSPQSADEVISARDRFKGALQDLLPHSEEESESSDEEKWASKSKRLSLQKKKQTNEKSVEPDINKFQQAFVMKLFDRSVDLAQFSENTPLYPICRAWIANQPHQIYNSKKQSSPEPQEVKEENTIKTEKDIISGQNVYRLPPPVPAPKNVQIRIPKPIVYVTKYKKFYKEGQEAPNKDTILRDNLKHWKNVRQNWLNAAEKNEGRYSESFKTILAIFNK